MASKPFKEITWDADRWTVKVTPQMTFPRSTKPRQRHLIMRNCSRIDLYFKILTDSSDLSFEYEYGDLPGGTYVDLAVTCKPGSKAPHTVGSINVLIKPKDTHVPYDSVNWMTGNTFRMSELAHVVPVVRTSEFAALETVLEMPGHASFVSSVPVAVEGIEDLDTRTAVDIERDVMTAAAFSMTDINDALASDTVVSTCKNILSDTATGRNIASDTGTARDIHEKNWVQRVLDYLFPLPDAWRLPNKDSLTEMFPCGAGTVKVAPQYKD